MLIGVVCDPIICPDCAVLSTVTGLYLTLPTVVGPCMFQAVSLLPVTAVARAQTRDRSCRIFGGQVSLEQFFYPVLPRSLSSVVPPVVLGPCSSSAVADCCAASLLGLSCFVMLTVE